MKSDFTLIGPFSQLVFLAHLADKGPLKDAEVVVIEDAAILIKGDKIFKTGAYNLLKKEAADLKATHTPLEGHFVVIPGFVDAHTHICFAGTRSNDYRMRNAGKTYLEISESGGGIWDTVKHTRNASQQELTALTVSRAERHLNEGVTTIEVKSGYGLTVEEELKMLRAIKQANQQSVAD